MPIRTPDSPAGGVIYECRRLRVPANAPQLRAAIIGAIIDMVHGQEWEEFGSMTIDDVIQVMFEAIISTSELCEAGLVIGQINDFMLEELPPGWLECDGSLHLITDYPMLYDVLPDRYRNAGNADQFQVPDLRARFRLTKDGFAITEGDTGGEASVTLSEGQMPSHFHTTTSLDYGLVGVTPGTAPLNVPAGFTPYVSDTKGSDQPHNNIPPYTAVTTGIYTGQV